MPGFAPYPAGDGTYIMSSALTPETCMPVVDIAGDYGLFVRAAIESGAYPPGDDLLTCSEWLSMAEIARQIGEGPCAASARAHPSDLIAHRDGQDGRLPAEER
jgi:hypothetical protein